ncbi:MAG: hypothetical protein H0U53_02075 [Actinobacteria bacterium]|nr:hypothetical protein [Actinomycetota bacterium]
MREYHLQRTYGMSLNEYENLLKQQNNSCAICGHVPSDRSLHVDHDAGSGLVRGILCGPCNQGLGSYYDNPALLRAAAAYLEEKGR